MKKILALFITLLTATYVFATDFKTSITASYCSGGNCIIKGQDWNHVIRNQDGFLQGVKVSVYSFPNNKWYGIYGSAGYYFDNVSRIQTGIDDAYLSENSGQKCISLVLGIGLQKEIKRFAIIGGFGLNYLYGNISGNFNKVSRENGLVPEDFDFGQVYYSVCSLGFGGEVNIRFYIFDYLYLSCGLEGGESSFLFSDTKSDNIKDLDLKSTIRLDLTLGIGYRF